MKRVHLVAIVTLTAGTWITVAYFAGLPSSSYAALKPFVWAITVSGSVYWGFEKFAWRWALFRGWFVETPDLMGVWRVIITSSWNDEGGEAKPPFTAYMMIHQSFKSLTVRLFSKESASISIAYAIKLTPGHVFDILVAYRNTPRIDLQATRSRMHHGTFLVSAQGYYPCELKGHYWTDRHTNGSIELKDRRQGSINSFEEGVRVFAGAGESGTQ